MGGISSGQDIIIKFVVKPTSSILKKRKTINLKKQNTSIITKGRHDPCVGIRAVPVGEAMVAIVLADLLFLINKKLLIFNVNKNSLLPFCPKIELSIILIFLKLKFSVNQDLYHHIHSCEEMNLLQSHLYQYFFSKFKLRFY